MSDLLSLPAHLVAPTPAEIRALRSTGRSFANGYGSCSLRLPQRLPEMGTGRTRDAGGHLGAIAYSRRRALACPARPVSMAPPKAAGRAALLSPSPCDIVESVSFRPFRSGAAGAARCPRSLPPFLGAAPKAAPLGRGRRAGATVPLAPATALPLVAHVGRSPRSRPPRLPSPPP